MHAVVYLPVHLLLGQLDVYLLHIWIYRLNLLRRFFYRFLRFNQLLLELLSVVDPSVLLYALIQDRNNGSQFLFGCLRFIHHRVVFFFGLEHIDHVKMLEQTLLLRQ